MIEVSKITEVAKIAYQRAITTVPCDTIQRLKLCIKRESNKTAQRVLRTCLKSAELGKKNNVVVCQDTGLPVFYIKYGTGVEVRGDIRTALSKAISEITGEYPLRPMAAHPGSRVRPLSGIGGGVPIVYFDIEVGLGYLEITAVPKGAGCGFWSSAAMLPLNRPVDEMKRFVVEKVRETKGSACPPYVIGVGWGGTFEQAALLAAKASIRPLTNRNTEKSIGDLEKELAELVNSTGIGPMGLGGHSTALAVNIEYCYTHIPWNPVAVNIQCWPSRRATARIYADNKKVDFQ